MVDGQTSSDDVENSKPHPDVFHAALSQLPEAARRDVLAIGDSPYDAMAATKAGLRCIGFLCGGFPEQALRDAGCTDIYQGPADLLARLNHAPLISPSS